MITYNNRVYILHIYNTCKYIYSQLYSISHPLETNVVLNTDSVQFQILYPLEYKSRPEKLFYILV